MLPTNRWNLLLVLILIICAFQLSYGYETHIVEDECENGTLKILLMKSGNESSGILRATPGDSYRADVKCHITLHAPLEQGVVVSLRQVDFLGKPDLMGDCQDWIKIAYENEEGTSETKNFCNPIMDNDEAQSFATGKHSNIMALEYYTSGQDKSLTSGKPGFQLTFTAYHFDDSNIISEKKDFFQCDNGRYIWRTLTCDGHNNCGDLSDEGNSKCNHPNYILFVKIGCGISIAVFILTMIGIVYLRKSRRKKPSLRLQERRTESRTPVMQASQTV